MAREAGNGSVVVWMCTEQTRDDRFWFVLRERLLGVDVDRAVPITYPDGSTGRVRIAGFDDVTVALPVDELGRVLTGVGPGGAWVGSVGHGRWWRAVLTVVDPREVRVPSDLAQALDR